MWPSRPGGWRRPFFSSAFLAAALLACGSSGGGNVSIPCSTASASDVSLRLGIESGLQEPTSEVTGAVTMCRYSDGSNPMRVFIRYETGMTQVDFDASKKGFVDHDEPVTDVSGLGDAAFSSTLGSPATIETNTIVVLKGSVTLLITSNAPLEKEKSLASQILTKL